MFFSSLMFSYQIFRRSNDLNQVVISIPRSWWWKPTHLKYAVYNDKYLLKTNIVTVGKDRNSIVFNGLEDGELLLVTIYYSGLFWNNERLISCQVPYRLKPARNLRTKILRVY